MARRSAGEAANTEFSRLDLSNAEIASVASEDLYENRPNRWRGPKSSWRTLTQEERMLWQSIKHLENQDLSVHLYNVFALKRNARNEASVPDLKTEAENIKPTAWIPPKQWTAWPLPEKEVPKEGLFKRQDDEDEPFTFRNECKTTATSDMREEMTATVLRLAKQRFLRRKREKPKQSIEAGDIGDTPAPEAPSSAVSEKQELLQSRELMDVDDDQPSPRQVEDEPDDTLEPAFAADDDASYKLLEPAVNHIISQLDDTLRILHNIRESALGYASESSTSEDDFRRRASRNRGRASQRAASVASSASRDGSETSRSRSTKGRSTPTHTPREGETERQMLRRIAREKHRRIPVFSDDSEEAEKEKMAKMKTEEGHRSTSKASSGRAAKGKGKEKEKMTVKNQEQGYEGETERQRLRRIARERHRKVPIFSDDSEEAAREASSRPRSARRRSAPVRPSETEPSGRDTTPEKVVEQDLDDAEERERAFEAWLAEGENEARAGRKDQPKRKHRRRDTGKHQNRWSLADWSDIIGAAAIAGFPPKVIERATQRCANLFGQSMDLRSLKEVPASRGIGFTTLEYRPEKISLSSSDSETDDEAARKRARAHRRAVSRRASRSNRSSPLDSERGRTAGDIRSFSQPMSTSGSRSRSRSRSAGTLFYCPVETCERSTNGFTRRPNLRRHMDLVHQGAQLDDEVDSEDEMVGAVHADGFLRQIAPGQGWRGEGVVKKKDKARVIGSRSFDRGFSPGPDLVTHDEADLSSN